MIFRRIKAHIQNENWFAVFIDFLIVVVGILIAFQINAWADRQADKQSLHIALERLQDEIQSNLTTIDKTAEQHGDLATAGKDLLAAVRDPGLETVPMELIGKVFVEGFTTEYSTSALTYVLNQHPLHRLKNSKLRLVIFELPAEYLDAVEDEMSVIRRLDEHWIPYISQYLPVASFWNIVSNNREWEAYFDTTDGSSKENAVSVFEFKKLASAMIFQNEIVNRIGYQQLILDEQSELRAALENALQLINEELE